MDIKQVLSEMTLEEKALLCSGLDAWHTKEVARLGMPSVMMMDGRHWLFECSLLRNHSCD